MIDLRLLIKNGVHFGHQTSRWSPKMKPYIWGFKNDIHLIDVSKTAFQLEQAAKFLESVTADGRAILWVGTKKAAHSIIQRLAEQLNLPYVAHRWVGGTFTNYRQVRKSIANLLHYEEILEKSEEFPHTKKELTLLKKRHGRLERIVGGIRNLKWPVGAVVVVDVRKEHVVVKEAAAMSIPVVALVDTNCDPSDIDYVIPANDDAPRSIEVLLDYLGKAVERGQEIAAAKPKEELVMVEMLETLQVPGTEPEEDSEKKRDTPRRPRKAGIPARPRTGKQQELKSQEKEAPAEAPKVQAKAPTQAPAKKKKAEVEEIAAAPAAAEAPTKSAVKEE